MTTELECVACGAKTHGAYLCATCTSRCDQALHEIASLALEVETTIARQARTGEASGTGDLHPLPLSPGAMAVRDVATNALTAMFREVQRGRGRPNPPASLGPLPNPLQLSAVALRYNLGWMRTQPDIGDWVEGIADARTALVRCVDTPEPHWYAGPCSCGVDLYGRPGRGDVRCEGCGVRHEASALREQMLATAANHLCHAELLGRALQALGVPTTGARIREWASRGRITAHGTDRRSRPLYRVGDVVAVAIEAAARPARRAS